MGILRFRSQSLLAFCVTHSMSSTTPPADTQSGEEKTVITDELVGSENTDASSPGTSSKRAKDAAEFQSQFNLPNEKLLDGMILDGQRPSHTEFNCAIMNSKSLLCQGKLYISENYICFSSPIGKKMSYVSTKPHSLLAHLCRSFPFPK